MAIFTADEFARDVARLLQEDPEEWSTDAARMGRPYILLHSSGVQVWVANGAWGLHIEFGSERRGDVSLFGGPGQRLIWRTYKRWLKAHPENGERTPRLRKALDDALAVAPPPPSPLPLGAWS